MVGATCSARRTRGRARSRIVAAADGNPLFVEQMAAMLSTMPPRGPSLEVPPTILALLAARLDRLDPRASAPSSSRASVVGLVFPSSAVVELVPEASGRRARAAGAVERRRFIRPQPVMGDDAAYQFEPHPRPRRRLPAAPETHARRRCTSASCGRADRGERRARARVRRVIAYHLEQAHRYLAELGPLDDHGRDLGRRAGERLAGAGQRAFARGDMHAAAGLIRRAVDLMPELHPDRLGLLPDLGEALMDIGEFEASKSVLGEAIKAAATIGDHRLRAEATLGLLLLGLFGD